MNINTQLSHCNYVSVTHQLTQIDETSFEHSTISDLPRIIIKRKSYVLRDWLDGK